MDSTGMSHDDDMLQEMRLAALLHRLPSEQTFNRCPSAFDVFRMATIGVLAPPRRGGSRER